MFQLYCRRKKREDQMTVADVLIPPSVAPPPRQLPYWRAYATFLDNPIEAWPRQVYEEKMWAPRDPLWRVLYVCDPAAIRQVLLDEQEKFDKGDIFRRMLKPAVGDGILTAEGAHWRWQRQAAAPAFRHDRIAAMTPHMARAGETALKRWRAAGEGARIDIAADMVRTTFDVILDTMLSGGEGFDIAEASREIGVYLETLGKPGLADVVGAPIWIRSLLQPRGRRATRYLREMVSAVIARRRASGETRGDLLDMLLASVDPETGRAMSDVDVRDNLITFIGAGHETTALALTWALYLVGRHPPTEARILEEVRAVAGAATLDADHIARLTFTRQVVLEAMRLYPPVAILPRVCRETTTLGERPVTPGTLIIMPIYALHRHRLLWDNPDAFDPDRFAPEKGLEKRRFAYMPFGAGPRICIGMQFALMEATAILATLVRGARVTPDPDHRIRPLVRITMRPEGGMPMTVRLR
jgi:cytochrome P450